MNNLIKEEKIKGFIKLYENQEYDNLINDIKIELKNIDNPMLYNLLGAALINKNDLINNVADAAGISKTAAASAVDSVFDSISSALSGGGDVRLVGFGTFSVANRKATTGRNPRTGEVIQIKASKSPKFKAGKALKDAVN